MISCQSEMQKARNELLHNISMLMENLVTWLTEEFVGSPEACSSYLTALFLIHYFHRWYENIQNKSTVNKCWESLLFCSENTFLRIDSC